VKWRIENGAQMNGVGHAGWKRERKKNTYDINTIEKTEKRLLYKINYK
jgi:hypothetical protein